MEDQNFKKLAMVLLYTIETAIEQGHWEIDGSYDPSILLASCGKLFGEEYEKLKEEFNNSDLEMEA